MSRAAALRNLLADGTAPGVAPLPWEVDEDRVGAWRVYDADGDVVAEVFDVCLASLIRLIAAAPEALALLLDVAEAAQAAAEVDMCYSPVASGTAVNVNMPCGECECCRLRAALARWEGTP